MKWTRISPVVLSVPLIRIALAVSTIKIQGNNFIDSLTGDRFNIIGSAYQPGGSSGYNPSSGADPLSNGSICLRDAALMQQLGLNAIRVYNLDPYVNHDLCASIFNEVGIYMLIDVNSPFDGESLNRNEPWSSYHAGYLHRIFAIVEAFKNYPNTLLFFAGNEVINDINTGATVPPYLRAVTRDLKNYIAKNCDRSIPVGYSAADVREVLFDTMNYLDCSSTGDESDPSRGDIFAINSYSWCGDSSLTIAGYNDLVENFKESSVPVFFSEYGCNAPYPRIFTEVPAIYSPPVFPVFSGGVVYEYSEEPSNFGIVQLNNDGSVKLLPDYDTLQTQISKLDMTSIQVVKAEDTTKKPKICSSSLIKSSGFDKDFIIPNIPPGGQELIDNGIPDAPSGSIISVEDTQVTQQVQKSNGDIMTDLRIKPLSDNSENYANNIRPTSKGVEAVINEPSSVKVTEPKSTKMTLPMKPSTANAIQQPDLRLTLLNSTFLIISIIFMVFF